VAFVVEKIVFVEPLALDILIDLAKEFGVIEDVLDYDDV
jgi:hypothetical protein